MPHHRLENTLIPLSEFIPGLVFEYLLKKTGPPPDVRTVGDSEISVFWEGGSPDRYTVDAIYTI